MANVMISPNDPAFWFHHAQVDRVWAKWQENNPGEMASIRPDENALDPWDAEFTLDNINNISNLGADTYEYV
jgi:tyrosinase